MLDGRKNQLPTSEKLDAALAVHTNHGSDLWGPRATGLKKHNSNTETMKEIRSEIVADSVETFMKGAGGLEDGAGKDRGRSHARCYRGRKSDRSSVSGA